MYICVYELIYQHGELKKKLSIPWQLKKTSKYSHLGSWNQSILDNFFLQAMTLKNQISYFLLVDILQIN